MKLPYLENAVVPQAKITEYLLSFTHEDGRSKAKFFVQFGFSAASWEEMARALIQHATAHEVAKAENDPFGTRYIIEGAIPTPDGRAPHVRSVWFIETGEQQPRFVTAYPLGRSKA